MLSRLNDEAGEASSISHLKAMSRKTVIIREAYLSFLHDDIAFF